MMQGCQPDRKAECVAFILGPEFATNWNFLTPEQVRTLIRTPVEDRPPYDLSALELFGDFVTQHPPVIDPDDEAQTVAADEVASEPEVVANSTGDSSSEDSN